jgi:hypothetical protein
MDRRRNVWPALSKEFAALHIPSSWQLERTERSRPGFGVPSVSGIWTVPGLDAAHGCLDVQAVLTQWAGRSSDVNDLPVARPDLFGDCHLQAHAANSRMTWAYAMATPSPNDTYFGGVVHLPRVPGTAITIGLAVDTPYPDEH